MRPGGFTYCPHILMIYLPPYLRQVNRIIPPPPDPHHPGRALPDLRAPGDHGRLLRDCRRRAVRQPHGPRGTAAEDRRLHGDGAPRRAANPWRLRALQCRHLSAPGTRQTGLVLCEDGEPGGATPTHVRRGRGPGKEPQGRAAADLSGAAVGRAEGVAGVPAGAQPGEPRPIPT